MNHTPSPELQTIARKVENGERITDKDCLLLFEKGSIGFVGSLANQIKERLHGEKVFFKFMENTSYFNFFSRRNGF